MTIIHLHLNTEQVRQSTGTLNVSYELEDDGESRKHLTLKIDGFPVELVDNRLLQLCISYPEMRSCPVIWSSPSDGGAATPMLSEMYAVFDADKDDEGCHAGDPTKTTEINEEEDGDGDGDDWYVYESLPAEQSLMRSFLESVDSPINSWDKDERGIDGAIVLYDSWIDMDSQDDGEGGDDTISPATTVTTARAEGSGLGDQHDEELMKSMMCLEVDEHGTCEPVGTIALQRQDCFLVDNDVGGDAAVDPSDSNQYACAGKLFNVIDLTQDVDSNNEELAFSVPDGGQQNVQSNKSTGKRRTTYHDEIMSEHHLHATDSSHVKKRKVLPLSKHQSIETSNIDTEFTESKNHELTKRDFDACLNAILGKDKLEVSPKNE